MSETTMVRYFCDGEKTGRFGLTELLLNIGDVNGRLNHHTSDEIIQIITEEQGWFFGFHDNGHYVIIAEDLWDRLSPRLDPLDSSEMDRHFSHLLRDVSFSCEIIKEVMEIFHQHEAFPDESLDIVADLGVVVEKFNAHIKGNMG